MQPQTLQWWDHQIKQLADRSFSAKRVAQLEEQVQDTELQLGDANAQLQELQSRGVHPGSCNAVHKCAWPTAVCLP